MSGAIDLAAQPRTVLGKKVNRLRRAGIVPANIYGRNVASTAIQVPVLELRHVVRTAGGTGLIRIALDGEVAPRTVIVRRVQREFTTGDYLHVDFQQVSMTERMTVRIPVVLTGQAPVSEEGGVVVQALDAVDVECLPGDIPNHLEADLSSLKSTTDAIHVGDLTAPANVIILSPPELLVVSATAARVEEEAVEEAAAAEEQAEGEPGADQAGQTEAES